MTSLFEAISVPLALVAARGALRTGVVPVILLGALNVTIESLTDAISSVEEPSDAITVVVGEVIGPIGTAKVRVLEL